MQLTASSVLLLLLIAAVSDVRSFDDEDDAAWQAYKLEHGKTYADAKEDSFRRGIRASTLGWIRKHNEEAAHGLHHYTLADNQFADQTPSEYQKILKYKVEVAEEVEETLDGKPRNRRQAGDIAAAAAAAAVVRKAAVVAHAVKHVADKVKHHRHRRQATQPPMPVYANTVDVSTLPATVNWTTAGWVGPVMNQGQCGSCWSYSAVGAIEAQYMNHTGTWVQLSEQNLIDCSSAEGNMGCNGGNFDDAFWYVQTNGIQSLTTYPDVSNVTGASNQTCAFNPTNSVTTVNSWRNVEKFNELALQQAVALSGPVSAAIDAHMLSFQFYKSGVYDPAGCSTTRLDHAVLVVGYGVVNSLPYWLIQNSWGTSWGMNGYMMMARNANNTCGIATAAAFPVIE